ncbi:hypothetical protein RFI_10050, partial [Reticulomyxa filosa]
EQIKQTNKKIKKNEGGKLLYMAELMDGTGSVTGVDVNNDRLNLCRRYIRDFKICNVRLYCQDGCIFNVCPDLSMSSAAKNTLVHDSCLTKKMLKARKRKNRKKETVSQNKRQKIGNDPSASLSSTCLIMPPMLVSPDLIGNHVRKDRSEDRTDDLSEQKRDDVKAIGSLPSVQHHNLPPTQNTQALYDKVIVDAQCTHDGSIRHMLKHIANGDVNILKEKVFDATFRETRVVSLQKKLIRNGFELLKTGGVLVYSTCSFLQEQNEGVIHYLLSEYPHTAQLVDVASDGFLKRFKFACGRTSPHGEIMRKCVRFDPLISNTSGLFIAKISKLNVVGTSSS